MRRARVVLLALVGFALPARVAAGPVEEVVQLAVHPSDANVMTLRYQFGGDGLVFSRDGGASWQTLCTSALEASGLERPPSRLGSIVFGADGKLYMGVFGALLESDPSGCTWSTVAPFDGKWVSDVTRLWSDPSVLFAVTSSGGESEMNGVYRKVGAAGWEALGAQEAILLSRLHAVELAGGGLRLYESAVRGTHCAGDLCGTDETCCNGPAGASASCMASATPCALGVAPAAPNYLIRVSDDLGETWIEHTFGETDGTLRLEAVDPTDPDRIVVVVEREGAVAGGMGEEPDTIYVSSNAGASFTEWTTVRSFGGLAFAPDGRVWFGDRGDPANPNAQRGLSYAASLDDAPTLLNGDNPVSCVHYLSESDRVFACRRFDAAFADPTTGAYTPTFDFRTTEAMLDCPEKDLCALCERQLVTAWCGITHFPEAPICCCYSDADRLMDPNLTPGTQLDATFTCPPNGGAVDAGTDGDIPGGGDAAVDAAGGTSFANRDQITAADDGGCSCRTAGRTTGSPMGAALVALVLGLWLGRLPRRRRTP